MKRLVFLVCGVFLLEGFAFELSMSKSFEQKLEPTSMQISFTLNTKASSAQAVRKRFHPLAMQMKEYSICSGGAYTINPQYHYEKNKPRELVGFFGSLAYTCHVEQTEELDTIIALLDSKNGIELTQSPIRWVVKKEKVQEAQAALELQAVEHPIHYTKMLQEHKIAKCKVKKVSLNKSFHTPLMRSTPRAMSSSLPEPTKEAQEIQISAEYLYECKEL